MLPLASSAISSAVLSGTSKPSHCPTYLSTVCICFLALAAVAR